MKKMMLAGVACMALLPLAACSKAKEAINAVECKAIDAGTSALSKTDNLSADSIKTLADKANTAVTAVESASNKLPAATQAKLDDAKKQLDDAVAKAETDPEAAKQSVTDAAANLSSALEEVKTSINC